MKKDGTFKLLSKEQVVFGYRFSSLQGDIILGAEFILFETPGLKQKAGDLFKKRIALQDFSFPSCGCIFKNPFQHKAGFLIDSCGLKGLSRGGACVSPKHANFIINKGLAAYDDVDYLINKIKECVYKKYGITLEEEIKRWS
jgi:UDP-N-acetylmuramate dehydrogenase